MRSFRCPPVSYTHLDVYKRQILLAVETVADILIIEDDPSINEVVDVYKRQVFMVVDETAVGGDVHSDLMFVPAGSTADVVLTEGIISSENQNGLDAIHNYDVQSVADYLAANGYNAEISVYATGEQQAYNCLLYTSRCV